MNPHLITDRDLKEGDQSGSARRIKITIYDFDLKSRLVDFDLFEKISCFSWKKSKS